MKLVKNILAIALFILVGIPILVLFLPVLIALYPIQYFRRKRFEKKYAHFLLESSGKNFFCYNNRKNAKQYIEDEIIPNLAEEIEIVYLNGKKVETAYKPEFISEVLYKLNHYNGFPHLIKIRNGKLIEKSINNPFYNILNVNKPKKELLTKINRFFAST